MVLHLPPKVLIMTLVPEFRQGVRYTGFRMGGPCFLCTIKVVLEQPVACSIIEKQTGANASRQTVSWALPATMHRIAPKSRVFLNHKLSWQLLNRFMMVWNFNYCTKVMTDPRNQVDPALPACVRGNSEEIKTCEQTRKLGCRSRPYKVLPTFADFRYFDV